MKPTLLSLFTFFCLPLTFACADEPLDRPNVLLIAIDDLNDWVGCLDGHPQALTPNIDRLADRGILFTNAHCASPACNPSRAALFSGKMPWQTGVWSNRDKKLFQQHPEIRVLPHSFGDRGYTTFGTGKLMHSGAGANKRLFDHHFNVEQRWSPLTKQQVQYTAAELPSKGTNHPRHVVKLDGGKTIVLPLNQMPSDRNADKRDGESFDWGPFEIDDSAMGDTLTADWAIRQLQRDHQQPFFLGVGFYRPHIPLFAPAKYFKRFADTPIQLPPYDHDDLNDLGKTGKGWATEADTAGLHSTVTKNHQWAEAVKAYLASTTFVDAQVGRLLDALDAGRFGDNTIIVLLSDHGWHLGEKQHWGKWTGWERSTRVPFIIVPPKRTDTTFARPGTRCPAPVNLIDLYPTLIEMCKLKNRDDLDGDSLVPFLQHPDRNHRRVSVTVFNPGNVSVRDSRWRLIRYSDGSRELYDLENDPHEWKNLADDARYQKQIQELSRDIPVKALTR